MSECHTKRLGDIVELVIDNRGRNPKTYEEEGIPVIDNYLITSDGVARLSEVKRFIDDETYDSFLRKYVQEGDVLMTLVGNGYGKVATTPKEKCAIIQNTIGLRCDEQNDNQYLYYLLRSNRETLMNLNRGAAQPSIKVGDILDLEFKFPSLAKQRRVSEILRSMDEKIELNRQTNQTLEQIAQAIFKSWFVDFEPTHAKIAAKQEWAKRNAAAKENGNDAALLNEQTEATFIERAAMVAISGKSKEEIDQLSQEQQEQLKATAALFPSGLVDSELGEIPEGWDTGSLDDVCYLNQSSWTKKKSPHEVWYVDLANTKDGVIEDLQHYSWEEAPSRAKRVLNMGDTIVGTVRPGNRSFSFIGTIDKQLTASTGFAVLTPKEPEYTEFVFIAATSDENIDRLAHLADGGAYPAVRPDVVTAMGLVIPAKAVMASFNRICKAIFDKRDMNLSSEDTFKKLRDALLPKLLSGELDVNKNKEEKYV